MSSPNARAFVLDYVRDAPDSKFDNLAAAGLRGGFTREESASAVHDLLLVNALTLSFSQTLRIGKR